MVLAATGGPSDLVIETPERENKQISPSDLKEKRLICNSDTAREREGGSVHAYLQQTQDGKTARDHVLPASRVQSATSVGA